MYVDVCSVLLVFLFPVVPASLHSGLDASLVRAIERSPMWRSAVDRMRDDHEGERLPTDVDRRIFALIGKRKRRRMRV
jgi:hypothetical protein